MKGIQQLMDEMVEAAPDEARGAADSSRTAAPALFDLLASVDYDEERVTPDQFDAIAAQARVASEDLLAWVDSNCGT